MINILASKEMLARLTLRILNVVLPKDKIEHITYVGEVIVDTYDRFLMSQIIEAGIVGVMIFAGYSLVGLPYAGLVGVLSGVLSFIPYIGPFMACGIGMLFTFTESPIQALISLVVFMIVQIVDGHVVYPKVVGSSVGLVGMIFFIPIFAVIYRFVKEWVEKHEQAASVVAVGGIIDEEN